jgi:hypothetical protein
MKHGKSSALVNFPLFMVTTAAFPRMICSMRVWGRTTFMLIGAAGVAATVAWLVWRDNSRPVLPAIGEVAIPREEEQSAPAGAEKWGEAKIKHVFHERRVEIKGRSGRLLIGAVAVQLIAVVALLGTMEIPQPVVASGVPDGAGGMYLVPEADLVAMSVSVVAVYCLALAAALRIQSSLGLLIVAATVYTLYQAPLAQIEVGGPLTGLRAEDVWLRGGQLGVLALLSVLALGIASARWTAAVRRHAGSGRQAGPAGAVVTDKAPGNRPWLASALAVACVVAYFMLELGAWGAYAQAGQIAAGTGFLIDDLGVQTLLVPLVLTVIVLLYSTDLLEWGQVVIARIVYLTGQRLPRPSLFQVLAPSAAIAVIAYVVWRAPAMVPSELLVGAIIAAVAVLLARRRDGYAGWSEKTTSRAVLAGAVAVFGYTTGLTSFASEASGPLGYNAVNLYWAVSVPLLAAGLAVAGCLVARGGAGKTKPASQPDGTSRSDRRTLGLFLVLAGMILLAAGLVYFPKAIGLPVILSTQFSPTDSVQLAAALAALGWSGWRLARRRPAAGARFDELFGLLVCLGLVIAIIRLLTWISALSPYPFAAFFLILGGWAVIAAGERLNGDSDRYPHNARLMLFASFTIMTNAIVGYLGTLRTPVAGQPPMRSLTSDYSTPLGLAVMGPALVILAFWLRGLPGQESQRQSKPRGTVATPAPGAAPGQQVPSARSTARSRLGVTLAAFLVLAVVAGCSSPQTGTAGPYKASPAPGPECDTNGALWTIPKGEPVTTQCAKKGLEVTVSGDNAGDVQFAPPIDNFTQNYSVSVTVTFGSLTDGCVSIYTRSSGSGHYTSYICDSQAAGQGFQWGLERITPGKQWLLALGELASSSGTYTLAAAAENTSQRITIDAATASGTDSTLSGTKYIALGISNAASQPGSVTFSDFAFTPLPANPKAPAAGTPALPETTADQVTVWYTDFGKAEIALLDSRLTALGHTTTLAQQVTACGNLKAAVTTVRTAPAVPDPAAQPWLSNALTEYGKAATDCQAGAESDNTTESDEAASEIRLAEADITQFETAIAHD